MRSRYQVIKNNGVYFITSTIIEWIPVFTKREYFDIIVQSLSYCRQNKGLKLFAYVVSERKLAKLSFRAEREIFCLLKLLSLQISPFSRNDKRMRFRSGTM